MKRTASINYFVNLCTLAPLAIAILSGAVLQWEYHLHRLPDHVLALGLDRCGWSLVHKLSALTALAGVTAHCVRHRNTIAAAFKRTSRRKIGHSLILFLLCLPLSITALISWPMSLHADAPRMALVEIHDKLAIPFVLLAIYHVYSRAGRMIRMLPGMIKQMRTSLPEG